MRGITNINMVENPHQKQAHIPVFSRTFDEIPVYSRPGIIIIKFQYFPGFPGSVRTLLRGGGGVVVIRISAHYRVRANVISITVGSGCRCPISRQKQYVTFVCNLSM